MDLRPLIIAPKTIGRLQDWTIDDLPPRWSVFPKTRRTPPGWQWCAFHLDCEDREPLRLLLQAHPGRDNWKAWLIEGHGNLARVAVRLEHHGGSGEGLHVHASCADRDPVYGPPSIQAAADRRIPQGTARRSGPWTKRQFRDYALAVFRVRTADSRQGELDL